MATFPSKHSVDNRTFLTLSITTAADGLSDVGDLSGHRLAGIETATAWTAADIALLGSPLSTASLSEMYALNSSSTLANMIRVVSTANRITGFGDKMCDAVRFIQLASIATGSTAAVAQAAARSCRLLLDKLL